MKPNPLASLNHLTVPVMRAIELILFPRRAICKASTIGKQHPTPPAASPDTRPRDALSLRQPWRRASFVQQPAGLRRAGDVMRCPAAALALQGHVSELRWRHLTRVALNGA